MFKPGQSTSTDTDLIRQNLLDYDFPEGMSSTDIACWYVGSENRGYSKTDMQKREAWLNQYDSALPTSGLVLKVINQLIDVGIFERNYQQKVRRV